MIRTLLISPHADDETLFAAFTCLRYQPHIITCFLPAEVERVGEADVAAELLGCTRTQWPLTEGATDDEVEAWMIGLRDPSGADDWDKVFAPAVLRDGYPDHNRVAEIVKRTFSDVPITWYLTYAGYPRKKARSDHEVTFEPEWVWTKLRALAAYQSQAQSKSFFHFVEDMREYLQ